MFQDAESNESDPYSLGLVQNVLQLRSGGRIIIHSWDQKRLARLGDGIGIALLKILTEDNLRDSLKVKTVLPMVRESFADPDLIAVDSDRQPNVTLFLLHDLSEYASDGETRAQIQDTIKFIEQKTKR
jgi:hypothetical protein